MDRWKDGTIERSIFPSFHRSWLLLSQAVKRPEPPDQVSGVDPHDGTICKTFRENPERHAILGVVESGHEHGRVGELR